MEAGMFCTIDRETFLLSTKNMWINDSSASCHMTNNDTCFYDVTNINKLIQASESNTCTTKKDKLWINVCQVNGTEWVHILWPRSIVPRQMQTCIALHVNFCEGTRLKSDKKNIMTHSSEGNIILDLHIKIHDNWVVGVESLWETGQESMLFSNTFIRKEIYYLNTKLSHPSEVITHTTTKIMGIHITRTFKPCEDCSVAGNFLLS